MAHPSPAFPKIAPGKGPEAHEDLTIAEHLESMRIDGEHRPGEQCFRGPHGAHCWVEDAVLKSFLAESGAVHPSDFLTSHGTEWDTVLFATS